MFPCRLHELAAELGLAPPESDPLVAGVSIDSRNLRPGELFAALAGERFDGHDFLARAATAGAAAALVQRDRVGRAGRLPALPVDDVLAALQRLAAAARRRHAGRVVAITGSHGKTTVKELLAGLLAERGPVAATRGNLNGQVGVPLTLLALDPAAWAVVIEVGISLPGEMEILAPLVRPEVAVVLNAAPVHTEFMGDVAAVARAKLGLLAGLAPGGVAVIGGDEPLLAQAEAAAGALRFGLGPQNDFRAVDLAVRAGGGTTFRLVARGEELLTAVALPGRHNVANALAALAAAAALGVPLTTSAARLPELRGAPLRMSLEERAGVRILNDAYNAAPRSTRAALETLIELAAGEPSLAVLGDMLELGPEAARHHREIGAAAARAGVTALLATGPLSAETVAGARAAGMAPAAARHYDDRSALALAVRERVGPGWTVLFKGSRGMAMEQVLEEVFGKT